MKYSELSADEREFLDSVHMAEQRSKAEYLSLLALLLHYMPKPRKGATHLRAEFENATRGDLKRAIKCMREVQSRFSSPEDIDGAIALIRRDFLRKEPA